MYLSRLAYLGTIVGVYIILYIFMLGCSSTRFESSGGNCSVTSLLDGALIVCQDGTSTRIYNGSNGSDGTNGQDGEDGTNGLDGADGQSAILEIIAPCNDPHNEVLIRLTDKTIIGHYSGGTVNRQALVVLSPGPYITTGRGSVCSFVVGPAPNYEVSF